MLCHGVSRVKRGRERIVESGWVGTEDGPDHVNGGLNKRTKI